MLWNWIRQPGLQLWRRSLGAPVTPNVIPGGVANLHQKSFTGSDLSCIFMLRRLGSSKDMHHAKTTKTKCGCLLKHCTQFLDMFSFHHFLTYGETWTYDLTSLNMTWSFSQQAKGRAGIIQVRLLDTTPSEARSVINRFHFVCIKDCCYYYFLHRTNCCCGNGSRDLDLKFPLWAKPVAGKVAANLSEKGLLDRSCWLSPQFQGDDSS